MRWLLYYCNCTILHQTSSNVSRYKFTFTAVYQYIAIAGSSRKLVKIGGLSEPLEPMVMGLLSYHSNFGIILKDIPVKITNAKIFEISFISCQKS